MRDIHSEITDKIVAALEKGVAPWSKSWKSVGGFTMPRRATGESYRGVNVIVLWLTADHLHEEDHQAG